jgi:phosphohistidine phosphatase
MKRLTVLRHAKSSWHHPGRDDFDRPLNERGWKAARRIGKELKHRKMNFDLGLASPAARVRETIDGLIEEYGQPTFPIRFEKPIYLADAGALLDLIRAIPDEVNAALLIGHNPGLERLLVELGKDDRKGLRDRVADKYPTAALAVVELPVKHWSKVEPGSGTITALILPRELD